MNHRSLLEELENVVQNQPLWPGDTISHSGAYELARLGLIRRGGEGNTYWFPTETGIQVYISGSMET